MVWPKKFGPAQNILGPVEGQGIRLKYIWMLSIQRKAAYVTQRTDGRPIFTYLLFVRAALFCNPAQTQNWPLFRKKINRSKRLYLGFFFTFVEKGEQKVLSDNTWKVFNFNQAKSNSFFVANWYGGPRIVRFLRSQGIVLLRKSY